MGVRYAGHFPIYPNPGDHVLITGGMHVGSRLLVLRIEGHAYNVALKVVVAGPSGEHLWYWPWNLQVEEPAVPQTVSDQTFPLQGSPAPSEEGGLAAPGSGPVGLDDLSVRPERDEGTPCAEEPPPVEGDLVFPDKG